MTDTREYVVGIDCSTTASKAIVWDKKGHSISEGRKKFPILSPRPDWREQRAEDWWEATCFALKEALSKVDRNSLGAVCITPQRETFVVVNEEGKPLRNAILWLDERAKEQVGDMDRLYGVESVHRLTGKGPDLTPSVYKILWLQENEPEIAERAYKYLDVHAYLVLKMSNQFCTSWACADPMGLFDMANHRWASKLMETLSLRPDQFPDLYAPGEVLGHVTEEASRECGLPTGLPIVAGGGDGQCASLGVGVVESGRSSLNLGTAVVLGTYSQNYVADRAFRTMNGCVPGTYLLESVIRGGTYTISWFVEKMGDIYTPSLGVSPEEILEVAASKIPPGSQGLVAVPHWSGSMTPYWDPLSKGITLGWSGIHGKAHFYRSILEGIAFEQKLINQGIEKALGSKIEKIVVLGGGARSQLWCQMVSDILNVPVEVAREIEATSLGAGMLAAYGAGLYPTAQEASLAMSAISRRYSPDPKRAEIYQKIFQEVYKPLFPAVQPLVDRLTELALEIGI